MFGKLKGLFGGDAGIEIAAPAAGQVVPLAEVPDPTFAQGILGQGVAVEPAEGRITAPADGTVDMMFDTGHAVSLTTKDGVAPADGRIDMMFDTGHAVSMTTADGAEVLIHVGIDTVQLKGQHYKACCKNGDTVKKGDTLIEFDPAAIQAAGYQTVTPVIVCNADSFAEVKTAAAGAVKAGDALLTLKTK